MKAIKKRGAVYGVIALMLCVAVYLNWSYIGAGDGVSASKTQDTEDTNTLAETTKGSDSNSQSQKDNSSQTSEKTKSDSNSSTEEDTNSNDYFSDSRLSRQKARDEAISILKETTENNNASESDKEQANKQISALADNTVKEARIESLVKAKGYVDCVTFINDSDVNVIVARSDGKALEASDVSKIKDIVIQETSVTADAIKIVTANA